MTQAYAFLRKYNKNSSTAFGVHQFFCMFVNYHALFKVFFFMWLALKSAIMMLVQTQLSRPMQDTREAPITPPKHWDLTQVWSFPQAVVLASPAVFREGLNSKLVVIKIAVCQQLHHRGKCSYTCLLKSSLAKNTLFLQTISLLFLCQI